MKSAPEYPPLPSSDEALAFLKSFDYFEDADSAQYAERHLPRILKTLGCMPDLSPGSSVLELGSSPFVMSLLVERHLGFELTPANFFGDYRDPTGFEDEVTLTSSQFHTQRCYRYKTFNLELDSFPYSSESFDLVLCCEILEHLARDPAHMIAEIHRVLRPGGYLLMTTPNAKRLENVLLMLKGHNVYERYSGWGVYGRHNREYTNWEVTDLLEANNFEAEVSTLDAYPHNLFHRAVTSLGPLRRRRDNLFALARKHGPSIMVRPAWLYEHVEQYEAAHDSADESQTATSPDL